jgi:galactose mutarotase-like enzyme
MAERGMDKAEIGSGRLHAAVLAQGAELCSLRDAAGRELIWQAGPAWPRHAPNLFPIVGRLKDDVLRHDGRDHAMTQHGFARDRRFEWLSHDADSCRLVLVDDAATREMYPFAFRLEIGYRVAAEGLTIEYVLHNPGEGLLPASIGAHPAFNWPLAPGVAKEAHRIVFPAAEDARIYQVKGGLLQAATVPSPVRDRVLALDEALFDQDALIFKPVHSGSVRYEAEGAGLTVAWENFGELGIWSRRGGDFVCIEPWHGYASPEDFDGDFAEKPGLMHLKPGETRRLAITVTAE